MADPRVALANIGKSHRQRLSPAPAIKAIKEDLIKVNFDPSKASAQLLRLKPKTRRSSSMMLFDSITGGVNFDTLEAEAAEDPGTGKIFSRRPSLVSQSGGSSSSSLVSNHRSGVKAASTLSESVVKYRNSSYGPDHWLGSPLVPGRRVGRRAGSDGAKRPPHGFRYHSNGDERVAGSTSSSSVASSLSKVAHELDTAAVTFEELRRRRAQSLNTLLPRTPCEPVAKRSTAAPSDTRSAGRGGSQPAGNDSPHINPTPRGRVTGGGTSMYKQTILRHLRDMAQAADIPTGRGLSGVQSPISTTSSGHDNFGSSVDADAAVVPASRTAEEAELYHLLSAGSSAFPPEQPCTQGNCFSPGNSSFNMRFGVPVKLMAQRKHILDEQHSRELDEGYKNDMKIASFLDNLKQLKQPARQQDGGRTT